MTIRVDRFIDRGGRAAGRRLGAVATLLLFAACVTPQIPLPPPDSGILQLGLVDRDQQRVQLEGAANDRTRDASIVVINNRTKRGVITPAGLDGAFATDPFEAADGDSLTIAYSRDGEFSDGACVVVNYDSAQLLDCP